MLLTLKIQPLRGAEKQAHRFTAFPVRIGRDDACELRLPQRFVSRRHARIELVGGGLMLIDEGSKNGIRCNGRRLVPKGSVALTDGCEIRIKRLVASVRVHEDTERLDAALAAPPLGRGDPGGMLSKSSDGLETTMPNTDALLRGLGGSARLTDGAFPPCVEATLPSAGCETAREEPVFALPRTGTGRFLDAVAHWVGTALRHRPPATPSCLH